MKFEESKSARAKIHKSSEISHDYLLKKKNHPAATILIINNLSHWNDENEDEEERRRNSFLTRESLKVNNV